MRRNRVSIARTRRARPPTPVPWKRTQQEWNRERAATSSLPRETLLAEGWC
ncbi:hypothetical protein D187_000390 [Cystobacter fuscus DSM 2262]|uniref:Uncharacterized protein n=1 Tax=Cystobacter fuscus (strain ATCC 25194 / DSM 2262 / NBRC 100088 / M29) TaxID=1242864 RepID=S9PL29_CYSF2|nr:hypothetical protein D187_000390 [Cystobacter fuscus DSM 2262]